MICSIIRWIPLVVGRGKLDWRPFSEDKSLPRVLIMYEKSWDLVESIGSTYYVLSKQQWLPGVL